MKSPTCTGRYKSCAYVTFEDVPLGRLYWLEDRSRGEEEMPFVLDGEGRRRFIYYDLVGM